MDGVATFNVDVRVTINKTKVNKAKCKCHKLSQRMSLQFWKSYLPIIILKVR